VGCTKLSMDAFNLVEQYHRIMSLSESEITAASSGTLVTYLGILVDAMTDYSDLNGFSRANQIIDTLRKRDSLTQIELAHLEYNEAGYHSLTRFRRSPSQEWRWEDPDLERELSCLLRAQQMAEQIPDFDKGFKCRILTNIGNLLSYLGRFVDAIFYWQQAIKVDANFGMAVGNLGLGAAYYSAHIHNFHTRTLFVQMAYQQMKKSLSMDLEGSAEDTFRSQIKSLEEQFGREILENESHFTQSFEVQSKDEAEYRQWCLSNTLFLNPVNDLGSFPVAATDDLNLPSVTVGIGDGPKYHGFYNEMKQEFASARWFAYAATHTKGLHYSDRQVTLTDTLDYPAYGIGVQYVMAAFRIAYSIFDKIAYFLNDYMRLGIPENKVYFRTIWHTGKRELRPEFGSKMNLPLRGLLWLSKDLIYGDGSALALDPDSVRLSAIRNHLEHKYLKVHDSMWSGPRAGTGFNDSLAYSISRHDLEILTMKMLRLVRSALIYLVFGVHSQERHLNAGKGTVAPLYFPSFDDDWKT
jgi:tetratricopeptide (TPR) repeat protein